MLKHTFCHIHGIGIKTEKRLWDADILSWNKWQEPKGISISRQSRLEIPEIFNTSLEALEQNNPKFFCNRLTSSDQWRIFPDFRDTTAFIDIETTGLSEHADITTIALYDGSTVSTYVNGRNLDQFIEDIWKYKVLVSYNGKSFDVPFIEKFFKIKIPHAHIDLRFVLSKLGIKGGLKGCEKQMGINRGALDGVDGAFAVYLWRQFEQYNDEKALDTLLAYNVEDTVNLERLLIEACNRNLETTPFAETHYLAFPEQPALIHQPDHDCVERIKHQHYYY